MTQVSIYDPFSEVFPALFRSVFSSGVQAQANAQTEPAVISRAMRVDVFETAEGYLVRADLPGVTKEAIQIDIDANRVTLRAQPVRDTEPKPDMRVLRSERFDGQYARSFTLTEEIDESRAVARLEHGVLELSLPRKAGVGPTRLTVQ
jgi:HSP20 family protein